MPNISARFTPNRPLDYSEPEIIKEIRRVILDECKGNVPSQTRFLKLARISHWTIKTKFGTYAQAIQKAGFVHEDTRTRFTPKRVTNNLHELLRRTDGYCFTYRVYRQNGGSYSFQTIKSILNAQNWAGVMETIGAKPRPHLVRITAHAQRLKALATLTESDLFKEIARVWQEKGRRPTYSEFRQASQIGIKIYESRFGSWVKAVESFCTAQGTRVQGKAGTHVTKRILLDELQALQRKRPNDLLTYDFYEANGGTYSIGTFQAHFGSWTKAVEAVDGISGRQAKYSKDELFDEMQRLWEKLGRQPSWREMLQGGKISPKCYKSVFGSWSKAVHAFCEDRNEFSPRVPSETSNPTHRPVTRSPIERPTAIANAGPVSLVELRKTGRSVSKRLRFRVLQRDNFTCQACGRSPAKHGVTLEIDHRQAYTKQGETVFENLQALCKDCNSGKSNL